MSPSEFAFTIPTKELDETGGGGDRILPSGSWLGTIEKIYVKDLHENVRGEGRGYADPDDVEILSIQFSENQPLDGQEEVATTFKHFTEFPIRDGEITHQTYDSDANGESWQMGRRMKHFAALARALGAVETMKDEDGNEITGISIGFQAALEDGEFDGAQVGFNIYHKPWVSGEKSGTNVFTVDFFQAA